MNKYVLMLAAAGLIAAPAFAEEHHAAPAEAAAEHTEEHVEEHMDAAEQHMDAAQEHVEEAVDCSKPLAEGEMPHEECVEAEAEAGVSTHVAPEPETTTVDEAASDAEAAMDDAAH